MSLFQTDFPPEEFAARRARIFEAIGKDAHALLQGATPVRGFELFRQSNQFYYCCGTEGPSLGWAFAVYCLSCRRPCTCLP